MQYGLETKYLRSNFQFLGDVDWASGCLAHRPVTDPFARQIFPPIRSAGRPDTGLTVKEKLPAGARLGSPGAFDAGGQ
jgi:hypothetical protein